MESPVGEHSTHSNQRVVRPLPTDSHSQSKGPRFVSARDSVLRHSRYIGQGSLHRDWMTLMLRSSVPYTRCISIYCIIRAVLRAPNWIPTIRDFWSSSACE